MCVWVCVCVCVCVGVCVCVCVFVEIGGKQKEGSTCDGDLGILGEGQRAKFPQNAAWWLLKVWGEVGEAWRVSERREIVRELE